MSLNIPKVFFQDDHAHSNPLAAKLDNIMKLLLVTKGVKRRQLFVSLVDFCGLCFREIRVDAKTGKTSTTISAAEARRRVRAGGVKSPIVAAD